MSRKCMYCESPCGPGALPICDRCETAGIDPGLRRVAPGLGTPVDVLSDIDPYNPVDLTASEWREIYSDPDYEDFEP